MALDLCADLEQKYQRCKEITDTMVAVKEAKGDDDVVAWQFLSNVITMLGSDGMSSKDSDGEDTKPIYCTHTLPWRRDIIKELNLIDQQRLQDSDIFSPRGAKAAKHLRSDNFSQSEQKAVQGLPCPFYDEGWFTQNEGVFRHTILVDYNLCAKLVGLAGTSDAMYNIILDIAAVLGYHVQP